MGVSERATARGFIAIMPNGTMNVERNGRFWNARFCCDHDRTNVDDDAYLTGLINEAQVRYRVDPENIYAIGHSNGGLMSQILACQHSDLFKGFVGLSPGVIPAMCWETKAKKVLMVGGTDDKFFPEVSSRDCGWEGGRCDSCGWVGGCEKKRAYMGRWEKEKETCVCIYLACERSHHLLTLTTGVWPQQHGTVGRVFGLPPGAYQRR